MTNLKSCPYCGGNACVSATYYPTSNKLYAACYNRDCLVTKCCDTEEEAIAVWNEVVDAINAYRRTCTVTALFKNEPLWEEDDWRFSCGHSVSVPENTKCPNFCPICGARVVGE